MEMKIQVDLDPSDVWRIQEAAERRHVTPGDVLREELARRRHSLRLREQVREAVHAGHCDADIAGEIGTTNATVASIRRGLGLCANPRYRSKPQDQYRPRECVVCGIEFVTHHRARVCGSECKKASRRVDFKRRKTS